MMHIETGLKDHRRESKLRDWANELSKEIGNRHARHRECIFD